jgi:hypothetical protein
VKGDRVIATYIADGAGVPVIVEGIVEAQFGQNKPCILEVPNAKVVSANSVTVTYELKRNGVLIAPSKAARARVIGVGLPELKKPTVQKTVSDALDPLDNPTGANGRVEVLGWQAGDTVYLMVAGAPGAGSPVFAAKPLNANNRANFALPVSFINANMGGLAVEVFYKLIRDGREHLSFSTSITVSGIVDDDPRLPTPAIDGAVGNELDVTSMQASDQLRVVAWPVQQLGQRVWLRYDGFDANGAAIFFEDRQGEAHDTVAGLIRPAALDWLKTLKNGSALTITFSVSFDGVKAVRFPVRTYSVKVSSVENFDSTRIQKITAVGGTIVTEKLKITLLSRANALGFLDVLDYTLASQGMIQGNVIRNYVAYGGDSISFSFELINGTASRVSLWYVPSNITISMGSLSIVFLNDAGNTLHTINKQLPQSVYIPVAIDSGILNNIKTIKVTANASIALDHFEFH